MSGSVVNVVVTTMLGVKVPMAVDPKITGGDLKDLVSQKAEVPRQFRLGFKSDKLASKRTLTYAGITDGAEIWMSKTESPANRSGHVQALGRTARGVQNGSIKHAIAKAGGELERAIDTRADGIETKLKENKELAEATGKDVSDALHILRGGEVPKVDGMTDLDRMKQLRNVKHGANQELTDIMERERLRKRQNKDADRDAVNDDAMVVEGGAQTAFRDVTTREELAQKKKQMLRAFAHQDKRMRLAEEGPLAEKKPSRNSKAWKAAKAAEELAAKANEEAQTGSSSVEGDAMDPEVAALDDETNARLAAIERGEFER